MTPPVETRTLPALLIDVFQAPAFGLPPEAAEALASATCRVAAQVAGAGLDYYLPVCLDRAERNAAIRREYNGHNVARLICKYGLSARQIYRIVK